VSEVERDGFLISTDPRRLDLDTVERFLRESYWAPARPRAAIEESVRNSLCFGLYDLAENRQIGLMRVVTDRATFAWLCDVTIDEAYRGRGLGKWMLSEVLGAPETCNVSRWILATRDAHDLYARYGFTSMLHPERWMERSTR
jgi:GNAT superfamily N-acetyltransferase